MSLAITIDEFMKLNYDESTEFIKHYKVILKLLCIYSIVKEIVNKFVCEMLTFKLTDFKYLPTKSTVGNDGC